MSAFSVRFSLILLLAAVLLVTAALAGAQALSTGCSSVGASPLNGTFGGGPSGSFTALFAAGEVVTFQVTGTGTAEFRFRQAPALPFPPVLVTVVSTPITGVFNYAYTIPADGQRILEVNNIGPAGSSITVTATCGLPGGGATGGVGGQTVSLPPCLDIQDGRINDDYLLDCGAPVAIYPGSIDIYSIDPSSSMGRLSLRLTDEELAAAGVPKVNTLLAETVNPFTNWPIRVYVLTTGEIQVNTYYGDGKAYTVAWPIRQPYSLYHLDW